MRQIWSVARRPAVVLVALVSMVGMAPTAPSYGSPATGDGESQAPNVLLVNLDDATELMLNWRKPDGTSVMPNVAAFAAQSTVFPNTFVDIPSCCPSRFSTFTGRYPHNTGGLTQDDGPMLPPKQTFAYQLRRAGYATAMAGKFLVSWPLEKRPPGYGRYSMIKGGYDDPTINRNGTTNKVPGYSTNLLEQDLQRYLKRFEKRDDAQPWFAYWAPQAPHIVGGFKTLAVPEVQYADVDMGVCAQPIEPDRSDKPPWVRFVEPDPAYDQALCASQLRALISVDDRFQHLVTRLHASGEWDETMVIVTSDNGYHWGEQGWFSKFYPYEGSIGVPLAVKWPASYGRPPGVDQRLASSLDVTATIYEVCGLKPPKPLDGKSLGTPGARDEIFVEYFQDSNNGDMGSFAELRGPTWKYVEETQTSRSGVITTFEEYYDLVADPDESENVLHDKIIGNEPPPDVLTALAARLEAARHCAAEGCP
jgi:arylsulfatase A-like enzyme